MKTLIESARKFATYHHGAIDHRRKYTNEPYIVHPRAVAALVAGHGGTPEMIASSLLHDVIEDTPATIEEVTSEFGPIVGNYVSFLTDVAVPEDGNRAERMRINNIHLRQAPSAVHTIKLADIYDNVKSIVKYDPKFALIYLEEKRIQIQSLTKGDVILYNKLRDFLKQN